MNTYRCTFSEKKRRGKPCALYTVTVVADTVSEAMRIARGQAAVEAPGATLQNIRQVTVAV